MVVKSTDYEFPSCLHIYQLCVILEQLCSYSVLVSSHVKW